MQKLNPTEITVLLTKIADGQADAESRLLEVAIDELRAAASGLMRREGNHTLQPTALVNEAFMRLKQADAFRKSPDRRYFFAAFTQAMRWILVEEARKRLSKKRGGGWKRSSLDDVLAFYEDRNIDLIDLYEALNELQEVSRAQAEVVQLRWLAEMTIREVAAVLDVSEWKIEADWRMARAFLKKRLSEDA
ncbi:MAG: ECF-type sigma factor [Planctomycetales bacterium]